MKERKIYLSVALLTGILILNIVSVASAADNNSAINEITAGLAGGGAGFGTTFQTQISNLSKSLLSSARIIAVIMTAAAGCMVCFGIQDGKKRFGIGYWE